jgi:8-oxo-dGTP diphosphatase
MSPRYANPALTVDAVAVQNGKVLLVRRGRPPFAGMWALPGGFVEQRETVEHALVRELEEETGLVARSIRLLGVYSGPDRDPRKPTTTVAFLVRGLRGRPRGGDDAGDARWIPVRNAAPLAFDHADILADALAVRAGRGPTLTWRRP